MKKLLFILILFCSFQGFGQIKGYWRLDGNSNDASGNGNNGTNTNITFSQANGRLNKGAYSSGGSTIRRVNIPSSASLISASSQLTVSCWVNIGNLIDQTVAITMRILPDPTPPYNAYVLEFNTTVARSITFSVYTTSGLVEVTNSNPVSINKWHHFVGIYNGSTISLYKDAVLIASGSQSGNIYYGSSRELRIADNDIYYGQSFTGSIDEVIIDNTVWSAAKVKNYYASTSKNFSF